MLKNAIWLFIIASVILAVFLPNYTMMQDLRQKNIAYQNEIIKLKQENDELKKEEDLLENDPEYLEKVAREKMGLIREGEVVYKIKPKVVEAE